MARGGRRGGAWRLPPSPGEAASPPPRVAPNRHQREGSVPPGALAGSRSSWGRSGCERGLAAGVGAGWVGACLRRGSRAPLGAPEAPSAPRTRRLPSRPPAPGAAQVRGLPWRSRLAAALTHRALGRQVADILDGADVDDVDAAVLGRERRVLLVDPHRGRLCAGTAGRRALPIHGPGGLCKRTGGVRARWLAGGRASRSARRPRRPAPARPRPRAPRCRSAHPAGPAPARAWTPRRLPSPSRKIPALCARLCPGGGHAGQIFRRNLNTGRKYSIPAESPTKFYFYPRKVPLELLLREARVSQQGGNVHQPPPSRKGSDLGSPAAGHLAA